MGDNLLNPDDIRRGAISLKAQEKSGSGRGAKARRNRQ
jgi:hypothetical protein